MSGTVANRSTVQANAVNCVKGEIHNCTQVLRLNSRWASRARFTREIPLSAESPLMQALKSLHTRLETVRDLNDVDSVSIIEPFIAVVESPHTTGPMTGAALSSLHKFLLYGFMGSDSPRAREGIDLIARGISNFHFEETDPESDEVVLMKLLELSALCLRCEVGTMLSDVRCWEIFQTCYGISCAENASSLLSNTAGNTLAHIVLMIFSRPPRLTIDEGGEVMGEADSPASTSAIGTLAKPGPEEEHNNGVGGQSLVNAAPSSENTRTAPLGSPPSSPVLSQGVLSDGGFEQDKDRVDGPVVRDGSKRRGKRVAGRKPPATQDVLVMVMHFLSGMCNPRENSDEACVLALSLINIALEAGGTQLSENDSLVVEMQGDLCKHLLQSSQTDDLTVLSLTLRVVFNLFNSIKDHLKVQLEVFLTSIHLRILDGASHTPEQRELVLESLLEFCTEPALMLDVYINYDCDVQCSNLFETVCNVLARQVLPVEGQLELNTLNRLGLEGILSVIESMARRCAGSEISSASLLPPTPKRAAKGGGSFLVTDTDRDTTVSESDSEENASRGLLDVLQNKVNGSSGFLEQAKEVTALKLQQRKRMKRRLTLAAERFNSGQKDWISYAQELELLPSPTATPAATASFLKNTMGLDKKQLGEYLSKGPPDKYPFNGQVLEHYVGLFDFGATPFDEALRMFLLEFRLPGEAQCIDRLMEAFAKQYYEQAKGHHPFVDADSAFVLAFSIIMLNTDLHNPQIREDKRMKLEDFIRNNRSINGGEDLPRPFLESIYECIAAEEIIVHRDHIISMKDGLDVDYDIHWDGILNRSRHVTSATFTPASARRILHSAGVHERDMFASIADSSIKAIRAFFERSYDDILVLKAMHGFYCYSKICTYFSMAPAFNALLVNLFSYGSAFMAEAAEGHHPPPFPDMTIAALAPVNEGNDPSLTKGAGAHRGLLALKAALMLIRRHGNCVQEAWLYLVECIFTLCDLRALPSALSDVDDFSDATGAPLPPSIFATQCLAQAAKEAGEFTSFGRQQSRGLLGSLGSLFWGDKAVSGEGTSLGDNSRAAIEALAQVVDSCRLDQLFTASKDLEPQAVMSLLRALLTCRDPAAAGVTSGPIHPSVGSSRFEAHSVLALELGARVAFANRHRMDIMWPVIHTHIERVLSSPVVMKRLPFLVERVMVTVLRTSIHMLDVESLAPQLLMSLRLLEKLPADMMPPLSCRLGNGLLILIQGNSAHLNSPEPWQIIMTLLSKTAAAPGRGRASAWETISFMVERPIISSHNIDPLFQLLVRYIEGDFTVAERTDINLRDASWTVPALTSLDNFISALIQAYVQNGEESSACAVLPAEQVRGLWEAALRTTAPFVSHSNAGISKAAAASMQRLLFMPPAGFIAGIAWQGIFREVLLRLPVGDCLSPPADAISSPSEDACLASATIVSRTLLHHLSELADLEDFDSIWLTLVKKLCSNLKHPGTVMHETVQQIVTNMIMVMAHANVFAEWNAGGKDRDLLEETWKCVDPVVPSIRRLLNPSPPPPTEAEHSTSQNPSPPPPTEVEHTTSQATPDESVSASALDGASPLPAPPGELATSS